MLLELFQHRIGHPGISIKSGNDKGDLESVVMEIGSYLMDGVQDFGAPIQSKIGQ
jgi:hypothetical protein